MKKIIIILIFFILSTVLASAQELFIRNDPFFTEVYLKIDIKQVKSVEKKGNVAVISFIKRLKAPFVKELSDPFIQQIVADGANFNVFIKPTAEFTIVNDADGVKVIATKSRTNSDILSSYGVGKPLLTRDSSIDDDKVLEGALSNIDKLLANKEFTKAAADLNTILTSAKNDFYRQEALYRLGQTYLLLGETDSQYLVSAYETFDDFAKIYPDNFRTADALMKSADAKRASNQLFEALFTYKKIYESVPDLESKRIALTNMAEIYTTVGQTEKAIDMYQTYLRQFRTNSNKVNLNIAQLYYDQKELDLAFEYYYSIPVNQLINEPGVETKKLFSMAKTFERKKRYDDALKIYNSIFEKYPEAPEANDSIFNAAHILQLTGRANEADEMYLKLKKLFPDRLSGQQATVEYAKKYLNTKPYEYWNDFFKDLLTRPDNYGLHKEAEYMLITSMFREGNMDGAVKAIEDFLPRYPESPNFIELDKIREDHLFKNASTSFDNKDFISAEPLLLSFLNQYPTSIYNDRVKNMLLDIKFDKVKTIYNNADYRNVIKQIENHISENPESKELSRWFALLDDATYKAVALYYAVEDFPAARVAARQYLANFPRGKYRKEAAETLEGALLKPIEQLYKKGNYSELIPLYEVNLDWVKGWKNKPFKDKLATYAALSVYKLGSPSKARIMYSEIAPTKDTNYAILGLLLGDKTLNVDINSFDEETFKYIIGELEQLDYEMALSLLKQYTKDAKLATSLEYGIAKNISSDVRRQEILLDVYDTIKSNESARFDGSNEVYLDIGLLYFRKNDFKSAVVPLKQYTDVNKNNDEKRAEALYYLGKSFVGMNDKERGFMYYNEIIQTMPNSIYAGIAKSELNEDNWKQNLNKF